MSPRLLVLKEPAMARLPLRAQSQVETAWERYRREQAARTPSARPGFRHDAAEGL
jgi:hypothetical protein